MNNQNKNNFDQISEEKARERLIQDFKKEFEPKSHFDEWFGVYRVSTAVRAVLQAISLVCALTLIAYPSKYFLSTTFPGFSAWVPGIIFGSVVLFYLELFKKAAADNAFRRFFAFGRVPAFALVACVLTSGASIVSSVVGGTIVADELAPAPTLIDTSQIVAYYDAKAEQSVAFWSSQIESAEDAAKKTFDEGSWKGKISGRTKIQKYEHEDEARQARQARNETLAKLESEKAATIASAISQNEEAKAEAKDQTANVGFWAAVGCGILEGMFYLISFFVVRFRFVCAEQLGEDAIDPDLNFPSGGGGRRKHRRQKPDFVSVGGFSFPKQNGSAINNQVWNGNEAETNRKRSEGDAHSIEVYDGNKSESESEEAQKEQTKTFVLNKDVNDGTPTIKDGKKVLYYVTGKGTKQESVRYYTEADVRRMVGNYERRLRDAKDAKNESSEKTNRRRLAEWRDYQKRLENFEIVS